MEEYLKPEGVNTLVEDKKHAYLLNWASRFLSQKEKGVLLKMSLASFLFCLQSQATRPFLRDGYFCGIITLRNGS